MILALSDTFINLDTKPNLRAVILTGAGDEAFCAGNDRTELAGPNESELSEPGQALFSQIESCHVPVIAAVNGIAAGYGCELALACHLRIASVSAQFSLLESKLGIVSGDAGMQRLAREVGDEHALEMLTGKAISAQQALRFGLVNHVVPRARLLTEAEDLAREIAQSRATGHSCLSRSC